MGERHGASQRRRTSAHLPSTKPKGDGLHRPLNKNCACPNAAPLLTRAAVLAEQHAVARCHANVHAIAHRQHCSQEVVEQQRRRFSWR